MQQLGIVVSTYNRCDRLRQCLDSISARTATSFELIVADDGSTDTTIAMLRDRGTAFVTGDNRGIAWNKNRGLFYLSQVQPCRTMILIEDDCCPSSDGWECDWVDGALRWGHVNHAGAGVFPYITGGGGSAADPFLSTMISGQCSSFSLEAFNYVGFLDTRFGLYGHEHVEHTMRFLRAGYGGRLAKPGSEPTVFYLVDGNISVSFEESFRTEEALRQNEIVFNQIQHEPIHRWAWRTDEELASFRAEMHGAVLSLP